MLEMPKRQPGEGAMAEGHTALELRGLSYRHTHESHP